MKKKKFTDIKDVNECFEVAERPVVESVDQIPSDLHPVIMAFYKEMVMAEAANKLKGSDQKPDWRNPNQKKWFGWLRFVSSGSVVFCVSVFDYSNAFAGDASRLAFLEESDARHAFDIAPDVFEDFLTK